jgi:hypothetical protein
MIINPWWFYLSDVVETIDFVSMLFTAFGVIGCMICFLWVYESVKYEDKETIQKTWSIFRKFIITTVVFLLTAIIVPARDTVYKMLAASLITHENIQIVGESATDVVDYIVEKIDEVVNKGE